MAFFNFSPELVELSEKAMQLCAPQFAELDRMAYTRELPIRRAVSVREGARESGGCILHAAKGCFRRFRCVLRASKCRRASLGAEREKA